MSLKPGLWGAGGKGSLGRKEVGVEKPAYPKLTEVRRLFFIQ